MIKNKGPKSRYVIDGWKLHSIINNRIGFSWMIDIIEHFSKFIWSYPIVNNNAINFLILLKKFIFSFGAPEILKSDNWTEYKNDYFLLLTNLLLTEK